MARDRNKRRRRDRRGRSDPFASDVDRDTGGSAFGPTGTHEAFWDTIGRMIDERVIEFAPTTGTVTGMDGGRVKVHLDDEDEPREIGFPRRKGTRYDTNERVLVGKTRGGRQIVLGTFTDKTGYDERGVANEDLHDDAIDNRALRANAVHGYNVRHREITGDHLSTKHTPGGAAVTSAHIGNNEVKGDHLDKKQLELGHFKDKEEKDLKDGMSDASRAMDLLGRDGDKGIRKELSNSGWVKEGIDKAKSDASSASSDAAKAKDDAKDVADDLDKLENRLKKLEDKVSKL
jgi:hypothetical protein